MASRVDFLVSFLYGARAVRRIRPEPSARIGAEKRYGGFAVERARLPGATANTLMPRY